MGSLLFLALSGWSSFRNFGMPGVIGWATFRGSEHETSLLSDHQSLAAKGSAPKFSKRTILAVQDLFFQLSEGWQG